jgi:hypothetical protein
VVSLSVRGWERCCSSPFSKGCSHCVWFCTAGQVVESGEKKKVVILNVDMLKLEVHVSLSWDLVNRRTKKVSLLRTCGFRLPLLCYTFSLGF